MFRIFYVQGGRLDRGRLDTHAPVEDTIPDFARTQVIDRCDGDKPPRATTVVRRLATFAYLAIVLDAFSRKVIGWALATHLKAELAIAALDQGLRTRRPPPGSVIHHSDRGVQYACADYAARLATHHIQPSMSRIGNPYDKAKAERFMRTLKEEEVDGSVYRDIADARMRIGDFIETIYNRQRLHSALDYLSSDDYEAGLTRLRQELPAAIQNLENCS